MDRYQLNPYLHMELNSKKKEDASAGESYGMSAKERIKRLVKVLDHVTSSSFFTSLNDIKLVSSPIHRTNVIMEDQNFKKLLELWDFLENYLLFQKTFNNKKIQQKQQENLKQKINNISLTTPTEEFLKYEVEGLQKDDVVKANSTKEIVVSFETMGIKGWGRNFNDELTANISFEKVSKNEVVTPPTEDDTEEETPSDETPNEGEIPKEEQPSTDDNKQEETPKEEVDLNGHTTQIDVERV